MVYFRSMSDLTRAIRNNMNSIYDLNPDIVVGIARSGMIPATYISNLLQIPVTDSDSFIAGRTLGHGLTRPLPTWCPDANRYTRPLVVDDSILSGGSMTRAVSQLYQTKPEKKFSFLAVYHSGHRVVENLTLLEYVPDRKSVV